MRLPKGSLLGLHKITGIPTPHLCDYVAGRRFPSRKRAIVLEEACKELGLDVPKELWMFGTSEKIKTALSASMNSCITQQIESWAKLPSPESH